LALLALAVLMAGYILLSIFGRPSDPPAEEPTRGPDRGWIQAYFTAPDAPDSETLRGGPDQDLAEAIDSAAYSVDLAVFRLDLWSVRDALIRAHERGVRVRVVTESDHMAEEEIQDLIDAGIEVRADGLDSLMHHKFIILDDVEVWTGSMNLTVNGAYRHNNNMLRIRSRQVAQSFTREFEEMFVEGRFGALSQRDTPHHSVMIEGSRIEVWFSPDDGVAARLVELVRGAEERIEIMAFNFTLDALGAVVGERFGAGVSVRGVLEADQSANPGTELEFLRTMGVDLLLDGNPNSMHHKVMILDERVVVTGSYNFSRSAEEVNDENIVIIHDQGVAAEYIAEFERLFSKASP
jgi:phosphatidylserine/phosphatidylglycerophosphate/cardiolipin synthase-like enzyme